MAKNFKLIKGVEATPLQKLNESQELKNPNKYVYQGVFTQCSVPGKTVVNRNQRIYTEREMLRHLGYLRDTIKENNGRLLGELDHPEEGRFDVQMKEASHMITDLWYDDKTKCVMGKLEVLDTPNGKILKELINAGYPLYVSSRAAGEVNEKTKEVEIAQIFTYDVVCTPGFREARLERVDENATMSNKTMVYLNEALSQAKKIKINDIEVPAEKINESAIAQYNNVKVSDVNTPLLENEEVEENEETLNDVKNFLPTMNTSSKPKQVNEEETEEDESEKENEENKEEDAEESKEEKGEDAIEELSDEEKAENRKLILDIVGLDEDGEPLLDDDEDDDDEDSKSDEILDITAVGDDEDDEDDEKENDEKSEDEEDEETNEDVEMTDECNKVVEKRAKIKENTDKDIEELESILDSVTKAESVKESIIRRYPFAISLSESNFAKFASLRPKQKKRCAEFIEEHEIFDIRAINELWLTPLREEKKVQQNWLRLASQSDIDLYVAAPIDVQNAIEESAKYVILETQEQVDEFWHRTGLRQAAAQQIMNEKLVSDYRKAVEENREFQNNNPLGYAYDFIRMTENWFNNN